MKNRVGAFLLALCMCITAYPACPAKAQAGQILTKHLDLSDQVYQEGGYLGESSSSEMALLSLSQEDRRAVLAEKLTEAWGSFASFCDVSGYGITLEDLRAVYIELLNKNYQYFYVNSSCNYSYTSEEIVTVFISYNMTETEARKKGAELETAISKALWGAKSSWSELEKALYINDYLTRNCEYDTTYSRYTAYDALVEKTAVCQGYALAYQILARKLGLSCEVVSSNSLNHAWNLVKIGEDYYHVDVTWNDPVADRLGRANHQFFLKSSTYFKSEAGRHNGDDWVISSGLTREDADNTDYDSYFWDHISTGMEYVQGKWYGILDSSIYQYSCDGSRFCQISEVKSMDAKWMVWGSTTSYWMGSYASLASYNDLLYYSLTDEIYQFNPSTGESSVWYSLSEKQKTEGYIYGMRILTNGEMQFLLATGPNQSDAVGIYTAGRVTSEPIQISSCIITWEEGSYTYDGTEKTPSVTVKDGSLLLTAGTDYTVSYNKNIDAGTASLTITGTGDYTGSVTTYFTIAKADQTVKASIRESEILTGTTTAVTASGVGILTYTSDNTAVATVNSSGIVTGVSAGTAEITVTAEGNSNYNGGRAKVIVTVKEPEPTDISACTITLEESTYTYDGRAKTPSVTVKDKSLVLNEGKDYTISYSNNINAGKAVVKVEMKGNYKGTLTRNFTINKAGNKIRGTSNFSKTASTKAQSFLLGAKATGGRLTYKSGSKSVKVSSTGKVTIPKNFAGKATITITASGTNHKTVTRTVTVTVKPAATKLSGATNTKGKKATIRWSKLSYVSGYQIQYGTKSSFSGAKTVTVNSSSTTAKVLSGLAGGKTYYVRIRSFKTVGGTKLCSTWSGKKSVKIRK